MRAKLLSDDDFATPRVHNGFSTERGNNRQFIMARLNSPYEICPCCGIRVHDTLILVASIQPSPLAPSHTVLWQLLNLPQVQGQYRVVEV